MTRSRLFGVVVGASVLISACGTSSASNPAATEASPAIAPTAAATASPSVAAEPTFTPDDLKIEALIKDGYARWLSFATGLPSDADIPEMIALVKDMHTFVRSQVATAVIYTPSECTRSALRLYRSAMNEAEAAVESMLLWVQDGMLGDVPADADLSPAADGLSASVTSLQATLC